LEDYRIEIRFQRLSINAEPPSEAAFFLPRPVGSELLTVESASGTCVDDDVAEAN
jgi:hypothetical protein